jgi:hypothetical protein
MAQIVRRTLGDGKTARYDVRLRVDSVVRNKTFRLRKDADSYKRKVEGEELAGQIVDPRGGERAFGSTRPPGSTPASRTAAHSRRPRVRVTRVSCVDI